MKINHFFDEKKYTLIYKHKIYNFFCPNELVNSSIYYREIRFQNFEFYADINYNEQLMTEGEVINDENVVKLFHTS